MSFDNPSDFVLMLANIEIAPTLEGVESFERFLANILEGTQRNELTFEQAVSFGSIIAFGRALCREMRAILTPTPDTPLQQKLKHPTK